MSLKLTTGTDRRNGGADDVSGARGRPWNRLGGGRSTANGNAGSQVGAFLRIDGLSKRFGPVNAVCDVNLEIQRGELVGLLGPSGCGKTTTLNMIAGFILPDSGSIVLDGNDVSQVPIQRRNVGFVFQSHALFPHMTVFDNVAYGLRRKRVPKAEIAERVTEALETVGLAVKAKMRPAHLSGGQSQRVALARALVIRPDVLLLDEPLSSLDAHLRVEMRSEIRSIVDQAEVTAVFVTHDQEEAMAIADRIVVMESGSVRQVGTPQELYSEPRDRFVAGFIGTALSLSGTVETVDGPLVTVRLQDGSFVRGVNADDEADTGDSVEIVVRPEMVSVAGDGDELGNVISATLESSVFLGRTCQLRFGGELGASLSIESSVPHAVGSDIQLSWPVEATRVFLVRRG